MNMPNLDETRQRAIRAALGQAPFDVLLLNGTVIDTATSELREADIGLSGPWIASVHPRGTRSDAAVVEDASDAISRRASSTPMYTSKVRT